MKVVFLKSHPDFGYFAGDEADMKDPKELIEKGFVKPAKEAKETATANPKAEKATE